MNGNMMPMMLLGCLALAAITPASAEVYRVANKDDTRQFMVVDCPESPAGRDLAWVKANCTEPPATEAAKARSEDTIMIIGWSHEVVAPRDAE